MFAQILSSAALYVCISCCKYKNGQKGCTGRKTKTFACICSHGSFKSFTIRLGSEPLSTNTLSTRRYNRSIGKLAGRGRNMVLLNSKLSLSLSLFLSLSPRLLFFFLFPSSIFVRSPLASLVSISSPLSSLFLFLLLAGFPLLYTHLAVRLSSATSTEGPLKKFCSNESAACRVK